MHPKIVSSYRPHGKWGDFLACTIPAIWCMNILTNSNFILRLTEWQNESSLFTVRIHGRQWYWVYKMDLKNFVDAVSLPKNIGVNKWVSNNFGDLKSSNEYLHVLRLRYDNKWLKTYWDSKLKEVEKENNFYSNTPIIRRHSNSTNSTINFNFKLNSVANNNAVFGIINPTELYNKSVSSNILDIEASDYSVVTKKYTKNSIKSGNIKINNNVAANYFGKSLLNLFNSNDLSDIVTSYKTKKVFFKKNVKQNIANDYLTNKNNLWQVNKKNNYIRLYPNLTRTILSGNLYEMSLDRNNYNSVSIKNPNWDASDRVFLNISRRSYLDTINISKIFDVANQHDFKEFIFYKNSDHSDMNRWLKRSLGSHDPLRIIKYTDYSKISKPDHPLYSNQDTGADEIDLLRFRFNKNNHSVVGKDPNNVYFAFKQKRYNVRKKFVFKKKFLKNIDNSYANAVKYDKKNVHDNLLKRSKIQNKVLVNNNYFEIKTNKSATINYKFLKKNKTRTDVIPVPLAKRLIRTKRTLVVPAHINITVITNSYDVVHSWFVPSLGVKLDCVPGRSTHHSLYVDSVGFYYGQCAEICGRYHHHMPIRICALPFEHFLLWWHSYGAPKLLSTRPSRKVNSYYSNTKYIW